MLRAGLLPFSVPRTRCGPRGRLVDAAFTRKWVRFVGRVRSRFASTCAAVGMSGLIVAGLAAASAGAQAVEFPSTAGFGASSVDVVRGVVASGVGSAARPLSGVRVTVFEAGATVARVVGRATTDSRGRFALKIGHTSRVKYLVARDGSHRELVTLAGSQIPARVIVNELTTVAAAYATAQIAQGTQITGDPLQLATATGMAANLVSPLTGRPSTVITTTPNANETNAWHELGTLGNILAACVRAVATDGACARLFSLTGSQKHPSTWNAAQSIARHPASNVKPIFALGDAVHAYRPYLTANQGPSAPDKFLRLDAFTLAVKFNATGRTVNGKEVCPFGGLGNITFDLNGYAWVTNNVVQGTPNSSNCIIVLKPNAHPSDGRAGSPDSPLLGGGIVGQGFGIGFDPKGRVWSGNFGWGGSAHFPTTDGETAGGSVSLFTGSGAPISGDYGYSNSTYRVQGTVSDARGNVWLASYGNSRVQVLPSGDPASSYPFYADENAGPFDIRLDSSGDAWVSYTQSDSVSKLHFDPTGVQRRFTASVGDNASPKGVAVDSAGNGWVAAGGQDAVYAFDSSGRPLGKFSGGGIVGPWGISTDSSDSLWVANFGGITQLGLKFGVSRLCGAVAGKCPTGLALGDPMTPATGFTLPSGGDQVLLHSGDPLYGPGSKIKSYKPLMRQTAVQPDSVGNLWVTNNWKPSGAKDATNPGGDGLVIFVGVASPVAPKPYNGPPTAP